MCTEDSLKSNRVCSVALGILPLDADDDDDDGGGDRDIAGTGDGFGILLFLKN